MFTGPLHYDPYKLYEDLSLAQTTFAQAPRLGEGTSPVAI